jgi:hypothetical protein
VFLRDAEVSHITDRLVAQLLNRAKISAVVRKVGGLGFALLVGIGFKGRKDSNLRRVNLHISVPLGFLDVVPDVLYIFLREEPSVLHPRLHKGRLQVRDDGVLVEGNRPLVLGGNGEESTLTGGEVLDVVIHTCIGLFGYDFLYVKKPINFIGLVLAHSLITLRAFPYRYSAVGIFRRLL